MAFVTLFHEVLLPDRLSYGMRVMSGNFNTEVAYTYSGYRTVNVPWSEDLRMWNLAYALETVSNAQELFQFHQNRKGNAYGFRLFDHLDFQATAENFGRGDGSETDFNLRKIYKDGNGQLSGTDIDFANSNSRISSDTSGFFKDVLADSLVFIAGESTNPGNNGLFMVSSVDSSGNYFDVLEPDGTAADITDNVDGGDAITVDLFVNTKRIYKVMEGRFVDSDYPFSVSVDGTPTAVTLNENTGAVTFSGAPSDGAVLTWTGAHHWPVAFRDKYLNIDYDRYNHLNLPDIIVEEIKIFTS